MSPSVRSLLACCTAAGLLAGCGGGGGGGGGRSIPPPNPTPTPTATPVGTASAYICPTSDTASVARAAGRSTGELTRMHTRGMKRLSSTPTMLAVTYSSATASRGADAIARTESSAGVHLVRTLTFSHIGRVTHLVAVASPSQLASAEAALKRQTGVLSVSPTGFRRRPTSVNAAYWPNDPYFDGFSAAQNTAAGNPAPSTFEALPYAESQIVPGQWDMHAIRLEHAFEYSQSGNGSGVTQNVGALGDPAVKVAIIDTGEDPNHPELSSKIKYQRCFITSADGNTQSTSDFETDPDGHGTDVAGLAAADTNNGLGFTGAGGNVSIYGYRVYPTPADDCANDNNNDNQCGASTVDIASAIEDAVAQHVNVISMSLGGDECTNGKDDDTTEGNAVADAIAAKVVVVAAAGNSYGPPLEAPGCDTGVIAAGATSLADGLPNGSGVNAGTSSAPVEYVATYTDYGSPGETLRSASAWGIVAPGGDPVSDTDTDDLHWIEDIWTTTPYMASSNDTSFQGNCSPDYASSGTVDCRTLIAGTSMATPTVAGVAALILSATGGSTSAYQSPTAMKTLLCQTADDISDPNQGCGRINAYRAMAKALGDPVLP